MDDKEILKKYEQKLKGRIKFEQYEEGPVTSREYSIFKREVIGKQYSRYEKLCNFCEKLIKINPGKKNIKKIEDAIRTAHLNITPYGSTAFAIFISIFFVILAIFIAAFTWVLTGSFHLLLPFLLILIGIFAIKPLINIPIYLAARWRLKTSNQMVLCILYVVMYMRHTSNLEHALKFAADHIGKPLSLDLRKVFWDIENGRYTTLKESLDNYLNEWKDYSIEFVESFHLIESSLYEPSEARRTELLDKSLDVILNGTYEKMLHYAQDLRNPITMLHMLGVVLPILGLVIFPLVGSFLGGDIKWYHLAILYNLLLPAVVYFVGNNILAKRPTGYGENEITDIIPEFKQLETLKIFGIRTSPLYLSIMIGVFLGMIGLIPLIIGISNPNYDFEFAAFGKFLDYKEGIGPYGFGALLLSFFIPLALALSIGMYYSIRTRKLIKLREATKKLEKEFAGALFQFGNRVGDGIPVEVAFGKVAESMKGSQSGTFFARVSRNIGEMGMGVEDAIFDKKTGAVLLYPSSLIESSMKILVESSRKGPKVVAKSLISISSYIEKIHSVNERLRDLLSEIISSMKSQISFLTPIIAGIVVGLASMIVNIIARLGEQFSKIDTGEVAQFNVAAIAGLFKIEDIIPSYFFQIVVGVYLVEVAILLTRLYNAVENGSDKLNEKYLIGKNLYRSTGLYVIIAAVITIIFSLLAKGILSGVSGI